MDIKRPMTLLVIEDDIAEYNLIKEAVASRGDFKIIGITNSSTEALTIVKTYMPESIILDIELTKGEGNGEIFLINLKKIKLDFKPVIMVTTNNPSEYTHTMLRNNGADMIFYKKQTGYNIGMVLDSILPYRETMYNTLPNELLTTETHQEKIDRISNKINIELDYIGISSDLKGRQYIFDVLICMLGLDHNYNTESDSESAFYYIAKKYKVDKSSISRVIQTAINTAWRTTDPSELKAHYTVRYNINLGVPSVTEFIYYYLDKIKSII